MSQISFLKQLISAKMPGMNFDKYLVQMEDMTINIFAKIDMQFKKMAI